MVLDSATNPGEPQLYSGGVPPQLGTTIPATGGINGAALPQPTAEEIQI